MDFKKKSFGTGKFARKGFGSKSGGFRSGGRDFKAPQTMHQATCSDCGKGCEVPFRPTGERPVYCRDCFAQNAPASREEGGYKKPFTKSFEKREFSPRPRMESSVPQNNSGMQEVALQLQNLNTKLDRLIDALQKQQRASDVQEALIAALPKAKKAKAKKA